ncbi:unnamed protein product [Ixodes hexagonus]
MDAGSEDEAPCDVASPSPPASPDSNNNSEGRRSPVGSDNEDSASAAQQSDGEDDDNKARDSDAESRNMDNEDSGKGDEGSASEREGNGSESEREERSSPSSPVAEKAESGSGDEEQREEEEDKEDGRVSRGSSASGQQEGGEEGDQMDGSRNDEQDDSKSAASCHDSAPASPSPSETGAAEKSSQPSSPSRKDSEEEGEASGKEDENNASEKEEEKDDSDKEEENSEKDDSDNESNVGELIANIFGESDDESEFEGFGKEDLVSPKKKDKARKARKVLSDSEDEDEDKEKGKPASEDEARLDDEEQEKEEDISVEQHDDGEVGESADIVQEPTPAPAADGSSSDDEVEDNRRGRNSDFMSDFDVMMAKKKEESSRRRRRKDVDIISDTDDIIAEIIKEMKAAAEEDKELNLAKRAATKKLKFLPTVVSQLKKMDLKVAFLDQGVLHVMAEWLSPLPDKSLPHLQIREHMLRLLGEFPPLDQGFLKSSGIGRAVMYLYKHPKESKENREKAGKLINEWARPIFNLNTNYSSISKEEREQKDFERMPQKRKIRLESSEEPPAKKDIDKALTGEDKSLRPGEKGWIARARVPTPSTKDYVVRPKWNCDTEFVKNTKKTVTRLDRHMRQFQERKKKMKAQRAVTISIEGRNMSL